MSARPNPVGPGSGTGSVWAENLNSKGEVANKWFSPAPVLANRTHRSHARRSTLLRINRVALLGVLPRSGHVGTRTRHVRPIGSAMKHAFSGTCVAFDLPNRIHARTHYAYQVHAHPKHRCGAESNSRRCLLCLKRFART